MTDAVRSSWKQAGVVTIVGLFYWSSVSAIAGTKEPWDAPAYWSAAYPISMVLAVALGFAFRRRAWITGLALTFAQLPIMLANTGIGPLAFFAVALLAILSVPVVLAAATTSMHRSSAVAG